MLPYVTKQKLLELSDRVLAIEKEIVKEERRYQKALKTERVLLLLYIRSKISRLQRKENLFHQVIEVRLSSCVQNLNVE
jgi:hypothetical protein